MDNTINNFDLPFTMDRDVFAYLSDLVDMDDDADETFRSLDVRERAAALLKEVLGR